MKKKDWKKYFLPDLKVAALNIVGDRLDEAQRFGLTRARTPEQVSKILKSVRPKISSEEIANITMKYLDSALAKILITKNAKKA